MDPNDVVWQEYIRDIEELALDCWKQMYRFHQAAQHQGAPEPLLTEMANIANHLAEATKRAAAIKACFPKENPE